MSRAEVSYEISPVDNVYYFPNNIDVRICPKNGMSTLKGAIRTVYGDIDDRGNTVGNYAWRYRKVYNNSDQFDQPFRKGSFRIAVRRDPIDRFKSACSFIQEKQAYYLSLGRPLATIPDDLDGIISGMEDGHIKDNHFYTQTWYMGRPEDYDMVFHIDEMSKLLTFLQDACNIGVDIKDIHLNKSNHKLYNDAISPAQMEILMNFYKKDFDNGWCKKDDYPV